MEMKLDLLYGGTQCRQYDFEGLSMQPEFLQQRGLFCMQSEQ